MTSCTRSCNVISQQNLTISTVLSLNHLIWSILSRSPSYRKYQGIIFPKVSKDAITGTSIRLGLYANGLPISALADRAILPPLFSLKYLFVYYTSPSSFFQYFIEHLFAFIHNRSTFKSRCQIYESPKHLSYVTALPQYNSVK